MKKNLLLVILLMSSITSLFSQIVNTVEWDFKVEELNETESQLVFSASIDDQWHLYSQHFADGGPVRLSFIFEKSADYKLIGSVEELSPVKTTFDDIFEIDIKYFEHKALFKQKIKVLNKKSFKIKGEMEYQTCKEGECKMFTPDFSFTINPGKILSNNSQSEIKKKTIDVDIIKIDPIVNAPKKEYNSLWALFFLSFGFGLVALLTPCVFPMIPMTVSFFMHSSENKSKSIFNAVLYGVSIIAIYTIIGTAVALIFGPSFANWLSTHWLPNILFFLTFMIFAFSFFGMFEITMPSWLVNKSVANEDKGGVFGVLFMAFTLVLVSFSCTGPIVGSILVQSAGGEFLEPIVGMFGFSLAFALPFTFFAIFPSMLSSLPKSGGWLNSVKVVLGFLELAFGLKFLSIADQTYHWGILDREVYLAIWIVIFILLGLYLLGKLRFAHDSEVKIVSVPRLVLAIISFSFVVYLIPGMIGAPLKAISGYLPPQSTHDFDIRAIVRDQSNTTAMILCDTPKYGDKLHLPHGLKGYFDYDQALECAKAQNKPIFLDFTGHGCVNCREMEASVWSDPRVLKLLNEEYIILALYVDDKQMLDKKDWITSTYDGKVKKTIGRKNADFEITRFGVNAQPYYVLLDDNEKQLVDPRAYDLDADAFVRFLEQGIKNHNK